MTKGEILEAVSKAIPYPQQMKDLNLEFPNEIRFTWRGSRFRVDSTLFVEEVDSGMLRGSNLAILLGALLEPYIPLDS